MKQSMTRILVAGAAVLAVSGVGAVLGGGAAAQVAKPGTGANPFSQYIGQCIVMFVTPDLGARGVLRAVSDTYAELDVEGYPVVISMPHLTVTVVDADGSLGLCSLGQSTDASQLLESIKSRR